MKIVPVLDQFRPKAALPYPIHQRGPLIEQYADTYFRTHEVKTERIYLPIFWTNYHVSIGGVGGISALRFYLNALKYHNPGQKYWTICQLDGGTLVSDPDILVFGSGGNNVSDIPIPLLCSPHPVIEISEPKKYLASFIGKATHPVRNDLYKILGQNPEYSIIEAENNVVQFRELMQQSKFALCPQGRCPSSFRLYEAIQMGVVPVYISDRFWLPFNDQIDWKSFCVFVSSAEINSLDPILRNISDEEYLSMKNKLQEVSQDYFTLEKTCEMIKGILENE